MIDGFNFLVDMIIPTLENRNYPKNDVEMFLTVLNNFLKENQDSDISDKSLEKLVYLESIASWINPSCWISVMRNISSKTSRLFEIIIKNVQLPLFLPSIISFGYHKSFYHNLKTFIHNPRNDEIIQKIISLKDTEGPCGMGISYEKSNRGIMIYEAVESGDAHFLHLAVTCPIFMGKSVIEGTSLTRYSYRARPATFPTRYLFNQIDNVNDFEMENFIPKFLSLLKEGDEKSVIELIEFSMKYSSVYINAVERESLEKLTAILDLRMEINECRKFSEFNFDESVMTLIYIVVEQSSLLLRKQMKRFDK